MIKSARLSTDTPGAPGNVEEAGSAVSVGVSTTPSLRGDKEGGAGKDWPVPDAPDPKV